MLFSPSWAARPPTFVPRIPIVATGVRTNISPGLFSAISPETNTNTPCTIEKAEDPAPDDGSKINSSSTIRAFSPTENVDSSMKTIPTAEPSFVSNTSP